MIAATWTIMVIDKTVVTGIIKVDENGST